MFFHCFLFCNKSAFETAGLVRGVISIIAVKLCLSQSFARPLRGRLSDQAKRWPVPQSHCWAYPVSVFPDRSLRSNLGMQVHSRNPADGTEVSDTPKNVFNVCIFSFVQMLP